jgi:hypothetical protein
MTDGRDPLPRSAGYLKIATTAALLLLFVVPIGCGSDEADEGSGTSELVEAQEAEVEKASKITTPIDASDVVKVFPPTIVTDGDVEAEKTGTPERAFLEWWQAFQFHDEVTVEALTSKATLDAIGRDNLEELVRGSLGGIEVLDVSETGNSAQINAGLLSFTPSAPGKPPPRKPTNSAPATFAMVKQGGDWVFDETEYLQIKVDARNL